MCAASKRRVYPFDMTEVPPDGYVLKWSKVLGGFWCYEPFGHKTVTSLIARTSAVFYCFSMYMKLQRLAVVTLVHTQVLSNLSVNH